MNQGKQKNTLVIAKPHCNSTRGDSTYGHLQMANTESFLGLLENGVCYDQQVLLTKLCQPLPCFILYKVKHASYFRYLLTSDFCISTPYEEKDFVCVCVCVSQKMLQVIIEPVNFSFFGISCQGTDLDYCNAEWFALETNQDHSVVLEVAPKYCISDSFVDYEGYSIASRDFCLHQN